jgi:hypothetical protein
MPFIYPTILAIMISFIYPTILAIMIFDGNNELLFGIIVCIRKSLLIPKIKKKNYGKNITK